VRCLCIPLNFFVLYAVRVVSNKNRQLVTPRTYIIIIIIIIIIINWQNSPFVSQPSLEYSAKLVLQMNYTIRFSLLWISQQ
jgi:hypothetical protein